MGISKLTIAIDVDFPQTAGLACSASGTSDLRSTASDIVKIEIVCSDKIEHKSREESRKSDLHGHILPTWDDVLRREYEPLQSDCFFIDSALVSAKDAASKILVSIESRQQ